MLDLCNPPDIISNVPDLLGRCYFVNGCVTTKRGGKTDKKEGNHQNETPLNHLRNVTAQIQVQPKK